VSANSITKRGNARTYMIEYEEIRPKTGREIVGYSGLLST
jgi:hypothetical protein